MTSRVSVAALVAQVEEVARMQLLKRQELKHAQRQARRLACRETCPPWHAALAVYVLTNADNDALRHFVRLRLGESSEARAAVTEAYVTWEPACLLELEQVASAAKGGLLQAACAFAQEWKLADWIGKQNQGCGVSPNASDVWARRVGQADESGAVGHNVRGGHGMRARQWVRRFCVRWKGRRGRLDVHSGDHCAEARRKARARFQKLFCFFFGKVEPISGPDSGPPGGPKTGTVSCVR